MQTLGCIHLYQSTCNSLKMVNFCRCFRKSFIYSFTDENELLMSSLAHFQRQSDCSILKAMTFSPQRDVFSFFMLNVVIRGKIWGIDKKSSHPQAGHTQTESHTSIHRMMVSFLTSSRCFCANFAIFSRRLSGSSNSPIQKSAKMPLSLLRRKNVETSSLSQVSASFTSLPDLTSTSEEYAADTLAMASKFDYSDFEGWLCAGGDDRSLILDSGANKYHIKPQPIQDSHIFRGSCTGNPPTSGGYDAARALYEEKLFGVRGAKLDSVLRDIFQHQRERLATYLNLPSGTEIILCPSGSDAEYIPIAIARSLHPDKGIINGITQLNEIGAGSAPASTGLFFSKYAPFLGDHGLNRLDGFEDIDGVVISAREKDGGVVNASDKMEEFCVTSLKSNMYPIVHGVFGGKTGLRDDVMPGSMEKGDVSMGVVDACQGRFSIAELHQWLEQDSIVLFTTSKFYQAPPFCGAVIVPASIATKLSKSSPPVGMLVDNGLGGFLTDKELPPCLEKWKAHLKDEGKNNVGLALRWEAGLFAMESISAIPDEERITMTDEWANEIQNMVDTHVMLETFCVERSIVSIRIAKKDGGWLNMSEARDLFRFMSLDVSGAVPHASDDEKEALSTPAFIGQPVSVSESFAIVRTALGVDSLLSYAKDKTQTLKEDELLIRKLDAIAKYFDALQGSDL